MIHTNTGRVFFPVLLLLLLLLLFFKFCFVFCSIPLPFFLPQCLTRGLEAYILYNNLLNILFYISFIK